MAKSVDYNQQSGASSASSFSVSDVQLKIYLHRSSPCLALGRRESYRIHRLYLICLTKFVKDSPCHPNFTSTRVTSARVSPSDCVTSAALSLPAVLRRTFVRFFERSVQF